MLAVRVLEPAACVVRTMLLTFLLLGLPRGVPCVRLVFARVFERAVPRRSGRTVQVVPERMQYVPWPERGYGLPLVP